MKRIHINLSEDKIKYLDEYMVKNSIASKSKAISNIIDEHMKGSDATLKSLAGYMADRVAENITEQIIEGVTNKLTKDISPSLKSIKFASNSTDKNTQIMLELINGIYYCEQYGMIPTTEQQPTEGYLRMVELINKKIEKAHYRKSDTLD